VKLPEWVKQLVRDPPLPPVSTFHEHDHREERPDERWAFALGGFVAGLIYAAIIQAYRDSTKVPVQKETAHV
jgi:hypothetical protein